jgi:CelD/BcsL family acetyltransferase involved in cellulose biosynthesis
VIESLSVEEIRTLDGFEALEKAWNELVERSNSPHLASTFTFAFTWWKRRGHGKQLFILLLKEGERLVGIAPLAISEARWGIVHIRKVSLIVPEWLETDFIVEPGQRRECIKLAIEYSFRKTGCYKMEFLGIPDESGSLPILKELGLRFSREFNSAGCYLPIEGTWDSFMKEKSESFRYALKRYEKQLGSKGKLETVRVRRTDNPAELLERLTAVDQRSWKAGEKSWGVMSDLLTRCNENGWLDIFLEELDGTPIIYLFLIRYKGKAYAMYTNYGLEHASDSPGLVLFKHALKQLFQERDVYELDFLTSYDYLRRWTKHLRRRYLVTLYRGGLSGQVFRLSRRISRRKLSVPPVAESRHT